MREGPLCTLGHVATRRDLDTSGLTRREIDALARHPLVVRPRTGVYACAHLGDAERVAVGVGARLDCVTALRRQGVWTGHTRGLHLRMPATAGAATSRRLHEARRDLGRAGYSLLGSRRISVHWAGCALPELGARLEVPIADALHQSMACLPGDDLIAALESALHLGRLSAAELEQLMIAAPRRLRTTLAQVTPGAQSGYETKARLGFRRLGHTVEIQVPVPGVGHVDEVIDGVVALEIDGRASHAETFEIDRDRDLGTEAWGLRCLRIPAKWIDTRWEEVVATVERMAQDALRAKAGPAGRRSPRRARTGAEIGGDTPG